MSVHARNEVDALISQWHDEPNNMPLHKWLRLSDKEYKAFVEMYLTYDEVWRLYNERKTRSS